MATFLSSDALAEIGAFDGAATPVKQRFGKGFTPTKPIGTPTSRMTPKRFGMHSAHNTPKVIGSSSKLSANNVHSSRSGSIGTPTLVFDEENIQPGSFRNSSKKRVTPLKSIKSSGRVRKRTPNSSAASEKFLSESCSCLPSISGKTSAKKNSLTTGTTSQRPFSSPSSIQKGLSKLNLESNTLSSDEGNVSLLTISKFEHQHNEEESEKFEEKVLTPSQKGNQGGGRPLGFRPFGKTHTVSPADSSFSPASRSFLTRREEKERKSHGGGVMKKTNIQRVLAERRRETMFPNESSNRSLEEKMTVNKENGSSSMNRDTKVRTPRQLPSLPGADVVASKNKFSSPTDLFMSPVSRNFHTIGEDGKLRKGNVRKLIALKGKNGHAPSNGGIGNVFKGKPLSGLRESSLRTVSHQSDSSFNKK